jgi:hypothetical protein
VKKGAGHERKWKIATVHGENGHDFDIWAYGRTFEEARERAASGDPQVFYRQAQSWKRELPGEGEA